MSFKITIALFCFACINFNTCESYQSGTLKVNQNNLHLFSRSQANNCDDFHFGPGPSKEE